MALSSYRDLVTWQAALDLSADVYRACRSLPRSQIFALSSQLRRASVAVVASIAEGYGRQTRADYTYFLHVAYGSLQETEALLLLAERVDLLSAQQISRRLDGCASTGRLLRALLHGLRGRKGQPQTRDPRLKPRR